MSSYFALEYDTDPNVDGETYLEWLEQNVLRLEKRCEELKARIDGIMSAGDALLKRAEAREELARSIRSRAKFPQVQINAARNYRRG